MLNFILRRLLTAPLVMFAISIIVVGLTQLLTPIQRAAGYVRNEQQAARIDEIIRERGLDQPFPVQYWNWFQHAIQGDLGFSKVSGKPVLDTIRELLPNTVELSLLAFLPILVLGIGLGTLAALRKDKLVDQIIRVLSVIAFSLPSFVLGIVLLAVFYGSLGWLPGAGQVDTQYQLILNTIPRPTGMLTIDSLLAGRPDITVDVLKHLVLPVATLSMVLTATIMMLMRNNMLEAITSDYVRTARAKGLPERVVNNKHARRNALLSIVTSAGFVLIGLLSGSVITESIFAYPGIGRWLLQASLALDIPSVLGFALLSAVIVVVVNTIVDILYGIIDPRVRFD
ncbi:ABC transporter permease [Deinococcus lacus]|uniref:ABC transporter permease n=1 Tax=Deinococcus lacus TaxID=392561 RepID=A0ABW1YBL3_9DEIO